MQTQASLLADCRHIVAHLNNEEVVLVCFINNVAVEEVVRSLCRSWNRLPSRRVELACVELVETIHLDDANQSLRISRTGSIARSLQSSCPAFVVRLAESLKTLIALLLQELRVVDETLASTSVLAESVVWPIIRLNDIRPVPRAANLNAEVVVGFCGEPASSGVTFQQTLSQSDARRNAILVHLFDSPIFVLIDVSPKSLIRPLSPGK